MGLISFVKNKVDAGVAKLNEVKDAVVNKANEVKDAVVSTTKDVFEAVDAKANGVKEAVINTAKVVGEGVGKATKAVGDVVSNMSASDIAHTVLGVASCIPVVGAAAAVVDAGIYAAEGNLGEAALSLVGVIPGGKIAATAGKLAVKGAGMIGKGAKVAEGVVGAVKAADKVADGVKAADKVADGVKAADKVADGVKAADKVADGAKTADKVADGAKTADKVADGAKTADKVADGAKTADKVADGAKTADKAADGAKTADKAADTTKAGEKAADVAKAVEVPPAFRQTEFASSYQSRINQTPSPSNTKVQFTGTRGESFCELKPPPDAKIKGILDEAGVEGIQYQRAVPDFSPVSKAQVEIPNMQASRTKNFAQADQALAKKLNESEELARGFGMEPGKVTIKNIENYRKQNKLTWHELNDTKNMQLVPTEINATFGHLGGVGEINAGAYLPGGFAAK
ncbi:MAG: HNH endonuclease [Cystobacterineae bacterium]|nr:HNH endonuclease [Cystobacterineae bacterium]